MAGEMMEPELLAMLTEEERAFYGHVKQGFHLYPDAARDMLRSLAEARQELNTWKQEFTRTLDDGRPYVQDASEAGQELADAQANARMATADLQRCLEFIETECDVHKTGEAAMTEEWRLQHCLGHKAEALLADLQRYEEEKP